MKKPVTQQGKPEIRRRFPIKGPVSGWHFQVSETSPGVYLAEGSDPFGRLVSRTGSDPDALLDQCASDARSIVAQLREQFLNEVHDLIDSLSCVLTSSELGEVKHLVAHGELGEGLRTLAWVIVEENKRISHRAYEALVRLARGLVEEHDMPANLHEHVA